MRFYYPSGEWSKASRFLVSVELKQYRKNYNNYMTVLKVIKPVNEKDLTPEQKRKVLAYLMFLKEKRNGTINGQGCAHGREQREWIHKEDSSSPSVSIQALILLLFMITDQIDGKELNIEYCPILEMSADYFSKPR